jgi:DNA-binding transcriptional LysR family regulator
MFGSIHDSDIKLLKMFQVVAQCGGFSAAQAQLNLSQSAISTRMAQLEARIGRRLCERGRRTFRLTSDGKAVLLAAEKLFAALEDFRAEVAESQSSLTGELRIGLIDNSITIEEANVRQAIAHFAATAPEAKLSIYIGGAVELEQHVVDERLHLGVGLFHHRLESLEYTPLFREEHMLYCAQNHPLFEAPDEKITPAQLANARYVSWGYGEGLPEWQPPFEFKEVASSPYIEGVAYLILSGAYIGYLPSHYARSWLNDGQLRSILPKATWRVVDFELVRRRSSRVNRLMQVFIEGLGISAQG